MADDGSFNSMQAQLGLVGQGGSFNPLGIATPAPPPPPPVRHPGDIAQDIVRQTQTAMATTLQTTSAMRLGGMGGVAFGGGGAAGGGIGAAGAFAQQYQQNMLGINAQHVAPFSAQMMGMMGGMGPGFQPGMLPHPAMMTAPGMGIYRPFAPPQTPTVSPFPQMPMFQHPLAAMPPPPQFQTPMELSQNMAIQAGQRRTAAMFAAPGVAARAATDVGLGYMGAGLGAAVGARFGPMGAAIGGTLGMAAGAFGAEHFGLGATAQHIADRMNPFRTMAIRGQQMMAASQDWVTGGPDLNMMTGRGLSARGATHLGRMLEDTAFSSRFRRETGGAFSAQDLTKITNVAGQQGLLQDTQSVEQIHDRVKTVAKSLVSFMKIANEPNVVEALKAMGKARQMGMTIGETMDMAVEARMYSKMAGQSVTGLMGGAGMQGAMMFQQQGLSAGLGMRMGMGAMGSATAAVGARAFSPQQLAMLGGVQGVAQHEMEMQAAFLKQPMMAAALSTMGRGGGFGIDARATREMMTGRMDVNQMATRGVDNLLNAVRKQGVGAIAMQEMQSTEIQDAIGRALGPAGVKIAQMNLVEQQRKAMGLEQTPGGFALAGRTLGITPDQMKVMMAEASSPGYFETQRRQLGVRKMEGRALEQEAFERNRPGMLDRLANTRLGYAASIGYGEMRDFGETVSSFFTSDEETRQARERGQVILRTPRSMIMTDEELRIAEKEGIMGERGRRVFERARRDYKTPDYRGAQALFTTAGGRPIGMSPLVGAARDYALGGNEWDLFQRRQAQGGWASTFGGGLMERGLRLGAAMTGQGKLANLVLGSAEEIRQQNERMNEAARVFGRGTSRTEEETTEAMQKLSGVEGGRTGQQLAIGLSDVMGKMARDRAKTTSGEFAFGAAAGTALGGGIGGLLGLGAAAIFGGKTNRMMDIGETRAAARKYLESQGKKNLTEREVDEFISAATPGAAARAGINVDAFRGREGINMAAREASIAELQTMRRERLQRMVGTTAGGADELKVSAGVAFAPMTGGVSLLAAVATTGMSEAELDRINEVDRRMFRTGESADAGALATLLLASESDPKAAQLAGELEDKLRSSGRTSEVARARRLKDQTVKAGGGQARIGARMGSQLATLGDSDKILKAAKANRAEGLAGDIQLRRKKGAAILTGREDAAFAEKSGIEQLRELAETGTEGMAEGGKELVEKFKELEATGQKREAELLAEDFETLQAKVGYTSEREAAGGAKGSADKLAKDQMVQLTKTEMAVGKNFPNVRLFDEASQKLLDAAEYLSGGRKTAMESGAVITEWGTGG